MGTQNFENSQKNSKMQIFQNVNSVIDCSRQDESTKTYQFFASSYHFLVILIQTLKFVTYYIDSKWTKILNVAMIIICAV